MINFYDINFDIDKVQEQDLFVCSVGYEERSYYLLNKIKSKIPSANILVFSFDELVNKTDKPNRIKEEKLADIKTISSLYGDSQMFFDTIIDFISSKESQDKEMNIYIDYSYMPRMWYCPLPFLLRNSFDKGNITFLYSEGIYPDNYFDYPSAGIASLVPYSGKPTLRTQLKRTHIIALSYDVIRTEGLLSMLDPESIITCNAYDSDYKEIYEHLVLVNEGVISRADYSLSFHLDNFSFMVAKLCEVVNENLPLGDVVIIPEGPKPLIFALSLVGELLKDKPGITCLQILRNNLEDPVVEVKPNGKVVSFYV